MPALFGKASVADLPPPPPAALTLAISRSGRDVSRYASVIVRVVIADPRWCAAVVGCRATAANMQTGTASTNDRSRLLFIGTSSVRPSEENDVCGKPGEGRR